MTAELPLLPDLLVGGGDERLQLGEGGLNRYGHGPLPRPDDLAFGSSTASTISGDAFARLEDHRQALGAQLSRFGEARVHRDEAEAVRAGIVACLDAEDRPPAVILAASGTDIHLIASALVAPESGAMLTITLSEHETGSGIAAAISGRHFAGHTATGRRVEINAPAVVHQIDHLVLPARTVAGETRPPDEVFDELDAHLTAACRKNQHCLLVVTDVSKTGLLFPALDTVLHLKARFGDRLDILVDACQLRISPATVKAYLDRGYLVAITGSKFMGGPIFSGALLCPERAGEQLRPKRVPHALAAYCGREGWPEDWIGRDALPRAANFGLLMRWRAALFEWEQLRLVPPPHLETAARAFALSMARELAASDALVAVPVEEYDRGALAGPGNPAADYGRVPTIFPFRIRASGESHGRFLSVVECRRIMDGLATPTAIRPAVRLGQPVAVGLDDSAPIGALRLCLSASQLARAGRDAGAMARLIAQARTALNAVSVEAAGQFDAPQSGPIAAPPRGGSARRYRA